MKRVSYIKLYIKTFSVEWQDGEVCWIDFLKQIYQLLSHGWVSSLKDFCKLLASVPIWRPPESLNSFVVEESLHVGLIGLVVEDILEVLAQLDVLVDHFVSSPVEKILDHQNVGVINVLSHIISTHLRGSNHQWLIQFPIVLSCSSAVLEVSITVDFLIHHFELLSESTEDLLDKWVSCDSLSLCSNFFLKILRINLRLVLYLRILFSSLKFREVQVVVVN